MLSFVAAAVAAALSAGTDPPQVVAVVPRLGTLRADCSARDRIRLRYVAGPDVDERVRVRIGRSPTLRRHLVPGRSLTFDVPDDRRVSLTTFATKEPFDVRARIAGRLVPSNDGVDQCLARRLATTVHTKLR